jgi:exopolysaccharide biosynthesis protein
LIKFNIAKSSTIIFVVVMVILSSPHTYASDNTILKTETIKTGAIERTISYIKVDLSNPGIQINSSVANNTLGTTDTLDKIAGLLKTPENQVVAAINGAFFSAYKGIPFPWGTIQKNGRILHIGNTGTQIGIDPENNVLIDHMNINIAGSINGMSNGWYAWNFNHIFDNIDAVAIFTSDFGTETHAHNFYSIIVESGIVTAIQIGKSPIPKDGYVIVTGSQDLRYRFTVGDEVDYDIIFSEVDYSTNPAEKSVTSQWDSMVTTIGAGPMLLCDGQVIADGLAEGFQENKINTDRAQRSFVGVTSENTLIMGVVPSVSIVELAQICKMLGMTDATNLDGGASSGLYYKGQIAYSPGRLLSNALVVTYQDPVIRILFNGKNLLFDQPPIIQNGRTLVPLRTIFEEIGAKIVWDDETKTVTASKGGVMMQLQADNKTALLNGEPVSLDVPAKILNGRMLVPSRFVAESLGLEVDWNQKDYCVLITTI